MKIFSWDIGSFCNFKCFYCFFSECGWENLAKLQGEPKTVETIEQAWYNIYQKYGSCKIYITGGEPFCYPNFVEIIERIVKYHKVHITTNLSIELNDFIKRISVEDVELNTTFHPLYIDITIFLSQLLKLKERGFKVSCCYLFHPVQIREVLNYKKYFKNFRINLGLVKYVGIYNGKKYPESYTKEEIDFYNFVENWQSEKDSYIDFLVKENLKKKSEIIKLDKEKTECFCGKNYASVFVDGTVRICGKKDKIVLGNIYKQDVKLLDKSLVCDKIYNCEEYFYGIDE